MKSRHTTCHLIMDRTSEILLATTSVDYDVVLFSKQRLQETGINDISRHYYNFELKEHLDNLMINWQCFTFR